jgi:hypothetical protein
MKHGIFIFCFFLLDRGFSQIITEKVLYIPIDTNGVAQLAVGLPQNLEFDKVLYKFYDYKKSWIKYEYVKLDKDTLLYIEYDSLAYLQINKIGRVYLSDDCPRADTIGYHDSDSEKYLSRAVISCKPIKHGMWKESYQQSSASGHYKDGKRDGHWEIRTANPGNFFDFTYKNDTLIHVRNLNVLKSQNLDTIKMYLTGNFEKNNFGNYFTRWESSKPIFGDIYSLKENGEIEIDRYYKGYFVNKEIGKWNIILPKLTIFLEKGNVESYQLTNLGDVGIYYEK